MPTKRFTEKELNKLFKELDKIRADSYIEIKLGEQEDSSIKVTGNGKVFKNNYNGRVSINNSIHCQFQRIKELILLHSDK